MRFSLIVMLVLALVLIAGLGAAPVGAMGGAFCTTSPSSGPIGTVFAISCGGFAPDTYINTYMVEPDGRTLAQACCGMGTVPNNPKTDGKGVAHFVFNTRTTDGDGSIQLGTWTIVATRPSGSPSGAVQVNVTSSSFVAGGEVVATEAGRSFLFHGSGFAPFEPVDVWLTLPPECSGINSQFGDRAAFNAVDPSSFNISLGWEDPGPHPKANAAGSFTWGPLNFMDSACLGEYALTARALGSGRSVIFRFNVTGNAVVETAGAQLTVTPAANASTIFPMVTVMGTGFPAGAVVNCWATRQDGRALEFGNAKADAAGSFSLSGLVEDVDAPVFSNSAEPGLWSMTCATPSRSALAITTFGLGALPFDP